jgi:hypothetical protein
MSDINVNDLATLSPSALDGDYYGIVFTPNGDTNKVVFEDAVAQANSNNGCVCLQEASLPIASADVLQLNSTPLTIVAAQGAGTAIEVVSASVKIAFGSVAYATNTTLQLISPGGATLVQATTSTVLAVTQNTHTGFNKTAPIASGGSIFENTELQINVFNGDPTAGDSDITVYVLYRVITV